MRLISRPLSLAALLALAAAPASARALSTNLTATPHVPDNADLAAKRGADYPNGVWRDQYARDRPASGPLFFTEQSGSCAANSYANDGGNCVDAADGNSFLAVHKDGVYNVKEFGATGNNSTNDTAAIQAAINAASTAPIGVVASIYVVFPSGNYCISTVGGVSASVNHLTLIGMGSAIVRVCGAVDTTVITLNGTGERIGNLQILGRNSPTVTQPAVALGSACNDCIVDDRTVIMYGYRNIDVAAESASIKYLKAAYAYGPSIARATAGAYWIRDEFDQNYPCGNPPAASYTLARWQPNHTYSRCDLVTINSGAWVLQATAAGKSSGSAPSVAAYGINIPDGGVTWQLAMPGRYYAFQVESGAYGSFIDKMDATGSFTCAVALTNDTGGSGPNQITFRDTIFAAALNGGLCAKAGSALAVDGGSVQNGVGVNAKGIDIQATFTGMARIAGVVIYGWPVGVSVGQAATIVTGNSIHSNGIASNIGIDVLAGVSNFTLASNDLSTSSVWGSNATAIKVEAGTSDNYSIVFNLTNGARTQVANNGTGIHKTEIGNN